MVHVVWYWFEYCVRSLYDPLQFIFVMIVMMMLMLITTLNNDDADT